LVSQSASSIALLSSKNPSANICAYKNSLRKQKDDPAIPGLYGFQFHPIYSPGPLLDKSGNPRKSVPSPAQANRLPMLEHTLAITANEIMQRFTFPFLHAPIRAIYILHFFLLS
jgi:hypothetical protein